jgi:GNAT superfamily N-acetyltransferase
MKIQFWETNNKCYCIQLIDDTATLVSKMIIDIDCDEYPRYKKYCKGNKIAKIIRIETYPNYVGKGYASKLIKFAIKKFQDYNLVLLCSPYKRDENTDTLKTVEDLEIFYSKFGFIRTNEFLPTMIKKSKYR